MPDLPQALVTVEANPPLRPTDAPFQASVGLGALLTTLVQLSQRRQTAGLDVSRTLPQAEVIVETNNPINTAFLATVTVDANNPQGSIASRLPQSEVEIILRRFGSYSFNQGDLSSTIIVTTGQFERSEEKQLSQALVNVQTNEIQGGVVITDNLPQSTVEVGTALLIYSESNRMIQSFIEVSAFPPTLPPRIRALDPAIVRVQTYAPLGQMCSSVFDATATPANTNYGLIFKVTNAWANDASAGVIRAIRFDGASATNPTAEFSGTVSRSVNNTISISFGRTFGIAFNRQQGAIPEMFNFGNYALLLRDGNTIVAISSMRNRYTSQNSFYRTGITSTTIPQSVLDFLDARSQAGNSANAQTQRFDVALIDMTKVDINTGGECRTLTHIDVSEPLQIATINVETNLPSTQLTYHEDIPQARVDVETNLPLTGFGIVQSRVDVSTVLFARTFAYPMQTATVDVSANNPKPLPIYITPSIVTIETTLPVGREFRNIFDTSVTSENSEYAVIGKQLNVSLRITDAVNNSYGLNANNEDMNLLFRSLNLDPNRPGSYLTARRFLYSGLMRINDVGQQNYVIFRLRQTTVGRFTFPATWPTPTTEYPQANYGLLLQSIDRLNTVVISNIDEYQTGMFRIAMTSNFRTWLNDHIPANTQTDGRVFNIALIDTTKTNLDQNDGTIDVI